MGRSIFEVLQYFCFKHTKVSGDLMLGINFLLVYNVNGFEIHLRDVFLSFCLLVLKRKIMMICGFDSNKISKSLNFFRRENQFIPFGWFKHISFHNFLHNKSTYM